MAEVSMVVIQSRDQLYTDADLAQLPDDGDRYEIINGELIVPPAPLMIYQRVVSDLHALVWWHVREHRLGQVYVAPTDVKLSPYDTVEPDILFVAATHGDRIQPTHVAGPPDLVVEVLSPSTQRVDLVRKWVLYATFGVPEYWIVDPSTRTITVLSLSAGHYHGEAMIQLASSHVLPGFEVDVAELFAS